ncbi:MAG: ribosome-associated translation inhibitor RaiA [Candidatus Pacebacteria bacterium]|nr:ribosome-associated translation inhibitor RaiA [Candidatus Paceibacterota bacterium]
MNINIKATNIDLAPTLKEYVEKKLSHIEDKLIDNNQGGVSCDVEVGKTTRHHKHGDIYRAEFNLHIAGKFYRTEEEESNLYAAIDKAKDELFRTVKRDKKKTIKRNRRGMLKIKNILRGLKW